MHGVRVMQWQQPLGILRRRGVKQRQQVKLTTGILHRNLRVLVEEEAASNVARKVTCQRIALQQQTSRAVGVDVSNAVKKDTCHASARKLAVVPTIKGASNAVKKVTCRGTARKEVIGHQIVVVSTVDKMVTCQETALIQSQKMPAEVGVEVDQDRASNVSKKDTWLATARIPSSLVRDKNRSGIR
jgi:hypothetical protein